MAQTTLKPPPEVGPARKELPARAGRPRRSADRSRKRFAYWLIAPAVAFMVLVHLLPTAAGVGAGYSEATVKSQLDAAAKEADGLLAQSAG